MGRRLSQIPAGLVHNIHNAAVGTARQQHPMLPLPDQQTLFMGKIIPQFLPIFHCVQAAVGLGKQFPLFHVRDNQQFFVQLQIALGENNLLMGSQGWLQPYADIQPNTLVKCPSNAFLWI